MKIKRIEISGFKSFADRTAFDFRDGTTGIVGPNGCGKSNVVDAIRWCMGEQSAKNLRGRGMEDVIFSGSDSRKQLGMAEVSLFFSTEDGIAPARYLEYSEIQLTRRLYRNGESAYLINRTPCRLMDITELFMDTGVGSRAYSIIEQGKIGEILHARPEDRRFLIEEAAGVTRYKFRRQLAIKKIEATRLNLSRLEDVMSEIKRQLATLQRQAKKAVKFRESRDELRAIELLLAACELKRIADERSLSEREIFLLNSRIEELSATCSAREAKLEEVKIALLESEKKIGALQENFFSMKNVSARISSRMEYGEKELLSLDASITRLESENGELERRIGSEDAVREALLHLKEELSSELSSLSAELVQSERELSVCESKEKERGDKLEEKRRELFSAISESSQLKNSVEAAAKRSASISEKMERHERESSTAMERLEAARRSEASFGAMLKAVEDQLDALESVKSALANEEEKTAAELARLEKLWQEKREELNVSSAKLGSLKELEARFEGYGDGVKKLMGEKSESFDFRGMLADAINTPPELEEAVEAALAGKLQTILCGNEHDILRAIEFLRECNGGTASIALLSGYASGSAPMEAPDGCVLLYEMIEVTGEFAPLAEKILEGCYLADNMRSAIDAAKKSPRLTFVTRRGELVSHGGIVTGGSVHPGGRIIHKKREMRVLEKDVSLLRDEVEKSGKARGDIIDRIRGITENSKAALSEMHAKELERAGVERDHEKALEEIRRHEEHLALIAMEKENLEEERVAVETELKIGKEKIAKASDLALSLESAIADLKKDEESGRLELADAREKVTALRVKGAETREKHESALKSLAEMDKSRKETARRLDAGKSGLAALKRSAEALRLDMAEAGREMESLAGKELTAKEEIEGARESHERVLALLEEAENSARLARKELEELREEHREWSFKLSKASLKAEHLESSLLEKTRLTTREALKRAETADFDETAGLSRRTELELVLSEMGEVNLLAIDEYAEMEERYNFLSGQRDDLIKSVESLNKAIQRINRTTRERFFETYNLVNSRFQEIFPRLFCGGKGELRLTDEGDLLETGIDMIVQPPGKRLQNVTLLSGGEKALTAVALIFSIFMVKPAPFCILDEVDAPLDDANIGRFNEMVREMSETSQFIVITHNKTTMQVADTLYGITMESPGISRTVSVRLDS